MTAPAGPIAWPQGVSSAAAFTFDLDAESAVLSADPGARDRLSLMSHQSYGPLAGVPRLLAVLRRQRVRSTFFVPGYTAHRYPDVVREIAEAGHEIAHHGYLHERPADLDPDAEAAVLRRGIEALEEVAGVRPLGYRAPMWELSTRSPRLLAEHGLCYDSSLMDADHPYELAAAPDSPVVEIPIHWGLDDWEQYCFLPGVSEGAIESPTAATEKWRLEFDALHGEGGCSVLTSHPFLSGRPGRAAALERLIEHVRAQPGVWIAPMHEIAAHVRSLGLAPRQPSAPGPVSS